MTPVCGKEDVHRSDGKVTEVVISERGFPHELTHCTQCGRAMSKPISIDRELDLGYEAGYRAADGAWVPVASEADLPTKDGDYLVTLKTPSTDKHITIFRFYEFVRGIQDADARLRRLRIDHWLPSNTGTQHVLAWRPLPAPYQRPNAEEVENGR